MRPDPSSLPVFPIALLAEGQLCLVVGGGRVATRKVDLLLEGGARMRVVSPEVSDRIAEHAARGAVTHEKRRFEDADAQGVFLAFAATDDPEVNGRVLDSCRARGIPCCRVDNRWAEGDFVTPASIRSRGLTVSVSTGGKSCRRSRLVKDNLTRHIEMIDTSDLVVIGTSHNYLSLREREPFHLVGDRLQATGRMLMQVWGLNEFMLLNTCNRVELIAAVPEETDTSGIIRHILGFDHLDEDQWYTRHGYDAFEHVALLTAGLFSQTPGENHIVAQVKDALAQGLEADWANGMMDEWISHALHISKHIRQEIAPKLRDFEIEDLCLDYLAAEGGSLEGRRVAVLGAGVVGTDLVSRCVERQMTCDWFFRSTRPEVTSDMGARVQLHHFNELRERIGDADLIVCTTASTGYVLHRGHAPFLDQERHLFIVDLSIPRNVEPELDGVSPNLTIADLDDLKHWYRREAADMSAILETSRRIVGEHRDLYARLVSSFQSRPAE